MDHSYTIDQENSAWRVVDGEAVLINAETTFYYGLNESATRVWMALLEEDLSAAQLAERLAPSYSLSPEEIGEGIRALLEKLTEEKLLKRAERIGTPATSPATRTDGPTSEVAWQDPDLVRYDTLEDLIVCGE